MTGYPRSGTTWLSRLLADLYHCPLGGSVPGQDGHELAAFGFDRVSDTMVRKGHYLPVLRPFDAPPAPHTINVASPEERRIVHIVRHPFDVAVSASQYHRRSVAESLVRMINGTAYNLPPWVDYVSIWYSQPAPALFVRYEDLLDCPTTEYAALVNLCLALGLDLPPNRITAVYEQRSFLRQYETDLRSATHDQRRILDEGLAGRWREKMDERDIALARSSFREVMEGLGYDDH